MIIRISYCKESEAFFKGDYDADPMTLVIEKVEVPDEYVEVEFQKEEHQYTEEDWELHFQFLKWLDSFGECCDVLDIVED